MPTEANKGDWSYGRTGIKYISEMWTAWLARVSLRYIDDFLLHGVSLTVGPCGRVASRKRLFRSLVNDIEVGLVDLIRLLGFRHDLSS
jgi:hypothetical protein